METISVEEQRRLQASVEKCVSYLERNRLRREQYNRRARLFVIISWGCLAIVIGVLFL
jgi:hypothetical protein